MRVLLADDLDLVRDSVKTYIERLDPAIEVRTTGDLDGALGLARLEGPFDLVLLDFRMPGMNGIEGLDRVRAALPNTPLAILSAFSCTPEMLSGLARIRASFIPKTLSGPRLLSVLRHVMDGEHYLPPSVIEAAERAGDVAHEVKRLTQRERDVLSHLLQGLSNKEIARHLSIEEVTVRLHMRGIFRKLGARNRTQAVKQAIDLGLAC